MAILSDISIFNKKAECMPRGELEALQLARLKNVVDTVYQRVPFYSSLFEKQGIRPSVVKSLKDIEDLPFTKKTDLRDNYPFGLLSVPVGQIRRIHASSGTKGKPTVVAYTDEDLEIWSEICARSLVTAGAKPGDIIHNSYGYGLFTGGLGLHYGAEKLKATIVPASGGRTQQQILLLQDFGARVLCSTPSYALNIAYAMEELGIRREQIKLEIGIFGAEPWTEELRRQLEERLQIAALDIYGLSEMAGPGVAMECYQGKNGLHIFEDHFLVEIVDPDTGKVLNEGEEGELVFTTLTKQAIPLIRYRTGDLSSITKEACVCGRTIARMQRIKARVDDMLIIRGVNVFPSEIEKTLLQVEELAPHYQLVVARTRALDTLAVEIELTEKIVSRWGRFDKDHVEVSHLTLKVQELLKNNLGLTADINLLKPGSITRSDGKAVRVVDKRIE